MPRPKMSQSWTNEQRDCGSSRCFSVVSYAEPKMNLTTQIAKCIGSAHLQLIVWTSSKLPIKIDYTYFLQQRFLAQYWNVSSLLKISASTFATDFLSKILLTFLGTAVTGWPTVKWNFFPGFSRGFSAKFQWFSRGCLTTFSKNMIITYRSACTYTPFCFLLEILWHMVPHDTWYAAFLPTTS